MDTDLKKAFDIIQDKIISGDILCFDEHLLGKGWKYLDKIEEYYKGKGYVFSHLRGWFSMRYDPKLAADPKLYYQGEIKPIFKKEKEDVF